MGRPISTRTRATGTRKRRTRSPHPGVVLIPPDPSGRHRAWRARYKDPDTGRQRKVRLDPVGLRTKEARRDWAVRKSKALARRRMELEAGAPVHNRTPLDDAIAAYMESCKQRLRPRTVRLYEQAVGRFREWADGAGIRTTGDLTGPKLAALHDHLVAQRKQAIKPRGRRGQRKQTTKKLSAHTVNWQLRAIKSMLNHWRLRGLVPALNRDAIADTLAPLKAEEEQIQYLTPADLRRLLEAALRHDADMHKITRAEHRGLRELGTTPKHTPIAPFVACVLLTGMRLGEALALDWKQVDLDALDHDGRKVGEIHLDGRTKTKRARTVDLEVSPALRRLLAALKLATGGKGPVFQRLTQGVANAARKRLQADYGAPEGYTWQALRRTCGTYLTNAPGIYGAASAYRSARQLGHSVQVAERHYLGLTRGIPREARALEDAMQIADAMGEIVDRQGAGQAAAKPKGRKGAK